VETSLSLSLSLSHALVLSLLSRLVDIIMSGLALVVVARCISRRSNTTAKNACFPVCWFRWPVPGARPEAKLQ
jgi:hypothetical protein